MDIAEKHDIRCESLCQRRLVLIAYLRAHVDCEDWHAVRDAAVDIELIDAELKGMAG